MEIEHHKLPMGAFLANIEPFKSKGLLTDRIYHKMIPGCGATTLELLFQRNSIIIEPNVPVIVGKCAKENKGRRKHKAILGVYSETDVADIKAYIANRKGYKKILTTPEGFVKVKEALGDSMYSDYFLLFDECEKAIQDVNFRGSIIDPMDEFFQFDNKAFVSATPIIPSDPRFKSFKIVVIEPDYDFKVDINVLVTNNIVYQLKQIFDNYLKPGEEFDRQFFIFLKSTKRIRTIIKNLNLESNAVYCSDKSAKELRLNNIENVYDKVNDKFCLYNFLTSRFFSAVDIDFEMYACNPIIIMVSDVIAVEHSVIDPNTESIQICGRFRAPEDKTIEINKDIYHISNYNSQLTSFNEAEVRAILKDKEEIHRFITRFKPTSDVEYINSFVEEILKLNGFNYFLKRTDSELNHFMVDNFINYEKVKGYYKSSETLIERYKLTRHFNVAKDSRYNHYLLTDEQLYEITDKTKTITVNELISCRVKEICESSDDELMRSMNLAMVRMFYPEQMAVIDNYGLENAKALDYNINKIKQQLDEAKGLSTILPIIKYIHRAFRKGKYTSGDIEAILAKGIAETRLTHLKPTIQLLRNGARLSEKRCNVRKDEDGNWLKGYEILEFIHNF